MIIYIARDLEGDLHIFKKKPERMLDNTWGEKNCFRSSVGLLDFYFDYDILNISISWEDEPIEIEIKINNYERT